MATSKKAAAPRKKAAPKKAAAAASTNAAAPTVSGGAVPFKGESCIYVDAKGKEHDAVVAAMHGGCVADLTILSTNGNHSVSSIPDESRKGDKGYWKPKA